MRARAEALGGTFSLRSGTSGTSIIVSVPLAAGASDEAIDGVVT
jgi:signal transduction histidine kinase